MSNFDELVKKYAPAIDECYDLYERFMHLWNADKSEKNDEFAAKFFSPFHPTWRMVYNEMEETKNQELKAIQVKYAKKNKALTMPNKDWSLLSYEQANATGMQFSRDEWSDAGKAYDEFLCGCEVTYVGGSPPSHLPRAWLREILMKSNLPLNAAQLRLEKAEAELRDAIAALSHNE